MFEKGGLKALIESRLLGFHREEPFGEARSLEHLETPLGAQSTCRGVAERVIEEGCRCFGVLETAKGGFYLTSAPSILLNGQGFCERGNRRRISESCQ